jgi:hypothetical protein
MSITAFNLALARIAPLGYSHAVAFGFQLPPMVPTSQVTPPRSRAEKERSPSAVSSSSYRAYRMQVHRSNRDTSEALDARARRLYSKHLYNQKYRDRRREQRRLRRAALMLPWGAES